MNNGVFAAIERKQTISVAAPERHSALRAAAESLSRRNVDTAICEVMNEALSRLVELAYQQDAGGFCNVDGATGRFLIALPFGRNGAAKWGLRHCEANVLRHILFDWMLEPPSLLFYDRSRRSWYVALGSFPSLNIAKVWLRAHPVTVTVYRAARAKVLA